MSEPDVVMASTSDAGAVTGPCGECSAPASDIADGYCGQCGHRQPVGRDHVELALESVVGVTDRGLVHEQNEDAMAFAQCTPGASGWVVVVADGVSSSQHPEAASQAAVDAACREVAGALGDPGADLAATVQRAVEVAHNAVRGVTWTRAERLDAPSCTLAVAAWRPDDGLLVATVGDTRCYWFGHDGQAALLTTDDSWAAEQLALGADPAAVDADPRAHGITRWLGEDAPAVVDCVERFTSLGGGAFVACSDGLWNSAPTADALLQALTGDDGPLVPDSDHLLAAGRRGVAFANAAGGYDNITVVLATLPESTPEPGDDRRRWWPARRRSPAPEKGDQA
jgi:serine/threonine protein phosphatase PrpC